MVINISIQYNGGLLPDIILLTQCYYHRGTRLNATKRFCNCSRRSHLNVLTFSSLTRGCSERLGALRCFFEKIKGVWGLGWKINGEAMNGYLEIPR